MFTLSSGARKLDQGGTDQSKNHEHLYLIVQIVVSPVCSQNTPCKVCWKEVSTNFGKFFHLVSAFQLTTTLIK